VSRPVRILCTADLHIGRRSSRIPPGFQGEHFSAAGMWLELVRHALDTRMDMVALAGDVVDRDNRFFEATGPLERGLRELQEGGIPVVAVTGNHDFDVLPRVAEQLGPGFHLLGAGGRWETRVVETAGGPVAVSGWSFPHQRVASSPLDGGAVPDPALELPRLGLLHSQLASSPGELRYAPADPRRLALLPVSAWVVGHIHAPDVLRLEGGAPVVIPGSPLPLDPGEPGAHGFVEISLSPGRAPGVERREMAPVRYDRVTVDVTGLPSPLEARGRVVEAVREAAERASREAHREPELLVLRLEVEGRTSFATGIREALQEVREFRHQGGGVTALLEEREVVFRLSPEHDLHALGSGKGAAAALARLILELRAAREGGAPLSPDAEALVREGRKRLEGVRQRVPSRGEESEQEGEERLLERLQLRAGELLDTLMRQREGR